jgi:hypothetical protein
MTPLRQSPMAPSVVQSPRRLQWLPSAVPSSCILLWTQSTLVPCRLQFLLSAVSSSFFILLQTSSSSASAAGSVGSGTQLTSAPSESISPTCLSVNGIRFYNPVHSKFQPDSKAHDTNTKNTTFTHSRSPREVHESQLSLTNIYTSHRNTHHSSLRFLTFFLHHTHAYNSKH